MRRVALVAAALVSSMAFASTQNEAPKVVAFVAEARVEVDADGKLVKVEAAKDLPESIRAYIEKQLSTWKYVRRPRDGETGNAVTWVSLGACAVPAGNGYTMGLAFHGNGPLLKRYGSLTEIARAVSRTGATGEVNVHFRVDANGKSTVESIDGLAPDTVSFLKRPIERWVTTLELLPEEINGRPVAARETVPLVFMTDRPRRPTAEDLQSRAKESPECKQAAAAGRATAPVLRAVAVDSVMEIVPSI